MLLLFDDDDNDVVVVVVVVVDVVDGDDDDDDDMFQTLEPGILSKKMLYLHIVQTISANIITLKKLNINKNFDIPVSIFVEH